MNLMITDINRVLMIFTINSFQGRLNLIEIHILRFLCKIEFETYYKRHKESELGSAYF
jgi:hypothetical protein